MDNAGLYRVRFAQRLCPEIVQFNVFKLCSLDADQGQDYAAAP
jgi:hypothetical protein